MKTVNKWFQRIIRSRTIVFNTLVAGLAAIEGSFGLLQSHLDGNIFAYLTVGLTVGNTILRTITTEALKDK